VLILANNPIPFRPSDDDLKMISLISEYLYGKLGFQPSKADIIRFALNNCKRG
jgi:hypothetical protein